MATHSSILDWEVPWTEEPCGLQSMGSQGVGHDSAHMDTNTHTHTHTHTLLKAVSTDIIDDNVHLSSWKICFSFNKSKTV